MRAYMHVYACVCVYVCVCPHVCACVYVYVVKHTLLECTGIQQLAMAVVILNNLIPEHS